MTDFLCPTCGPITEDDGLLMGPGDAVCCAFCGCPEEDMTPLREAYEALVRETSSPVTGYRKLLQQLSDRARDNAVQQAKMWAQEARTQRATVMEIGELVGCENDWEMVGAVRKALTSAAVPDSEAFTLLMRDITEQFPCDPDHERAVCVDYDWLYDRIKEEFRSGAPAAVPEGYVAIGRSNLANRKTYGETANEASEKMEQSGFYTYTVKELYAFSAPAPAKPENEIERRVRRSQEALDRPLKDTVRWANTSSVDDQQAAMFNAHNGAED